MMQAGCNLGAPNELQVHALLLTNPTTFSWRVMYIQLLCGYPKVINKAQVNWVLERKSYDSIPGKYWYTVRDTLCQK